MIGEKNHLSHVIVNSASSYLSNNQQKNNKSQFPFFEQNLLSHIENQDMAHGTCQYYFY